MAIQVITKDTKIRIFNACVRSVLLYGCETWLVTKEIQRKIQTFVNRSSKIYMYIKNMVAKYYFQQNLWKVTGQEDINVEIKKGNLDGSVIHKEKRMERYQRLPYFGTLRETGREEDREIAGEDR